MTNRSVLVIASLCLVLLYSNCDSFKGLERDGNTQLSSSLDKSYPYSEDTEYFDDVQIIGKESSEGGWRYQFAVSVVKVADEDTLVQTEIFILDANDVLICPRIMAEVNRQNNHIQILECLSNEELDSVQVLIKAGEPGQILQDVRLHRFDLSSL